MKSIKDIAVFGGKAAAQQMYKDGQGVESNPYVRGSKDFDAFNMELNRLYNEELKRIIGDAYS